MRCCDGLGPAEPARDGEADWPVDAGGEVARILDDSKQGFGDDLDAELVGTHASDGFDEGLAESDRAAWEVPQPATWTLCALSQPDP